MSIVSRETGGLTVFCCEEFPPWAAHGFSTRPGGVSQGHLAGLNLAESREDDPALAVENHRRLRAALGMASALPVRNRQVHGDEIRAVTRPDPTDAAPEEADGLMTDVPGLCLTVFSADCIPILLCDPVRRVVAAVHAGWRGTALGIAGKAAGAMTARYGCRPGDVLAAIGPGISPYCFLTRQDVPDALTARLGREAEDFCVPKEGGEQFQVDLKGVSRRDLLAAGLRQEHISVSDACTACDPRLFWSHRRQGEARGSMAGVIALMPPAGEER